MRAPPPPPVSEYKWMWVEPKADKGSSASASSASSSTIMSGPVSWFTNPADIFESARTMAQESPYALLSGVGVTTAAVYVGGMVARIW